MTSRPSLLIEIPEPESLKIKKALVFGTILSLFTFSVFKDVHWTPWFCFTLGITFIASVTIFKLLRSAGLSMVQSLILALTWVYVGWFSLFWGVFRPSSDWMEGVRKIITRELAVEGALVFFMMSYLFKSWRVVRGPIFWALILGGLAHAVSLAFDYSADDIKVGVDPEGLMGNRSIGASYLAVLVFMLIYLEEKGNLLGKKIFPAIDWAFGHVSWLLIAFVTIVTAVSVSSISWLALGCGLGAYLFRYFWPTKRWLSLVLLFLPLGLGLLILPEIDPEGFTTISRYVQWPMFLKEYALECGKNFGDFGVLFGLGAGSAKFYIPSWQQKQDMFSEGYWLWAHNDWLEFLLEFGFVGLALFITTYFITLLKAFKKSPSLFAAVVAFGVVMIGNYPWQIALTSVMGMWLLLESVFDLMGPITTIKPAHLRRRSWDKIFKEDNSLTQKDTSFLMPLDTQPSKP